MSKNSDSEKLSNSAFGLLAVIVIAFLALIALLFSLNVGEGIF